MGISRKTKSVKIILDIFENSPSALSVVQLVENLSEHMNKTTVYRILDRLEQDGIVHSFLGNNGLKWYAKCSDCTSHHHSDIHPHFQCNDCGKVECLTIEVSIPKIPNREIEVSQILIQGKCENCYS
ncbi:transcriptional repressor [Winogradskyella sp. 3972H.M.0a.05]|uniref:Fur family transcriptional regulator n=1 Tax=Winogradskyella sp. 3972H.M.0a.05 TaxID=2950277 RepID=UPI0033915206